MLWIHPLLQILATLLAVYVLFLGFRRFQTLHLGRKTVFAWKLHVRLGLVALALWLVGMAGGLITAARTWPGFLITGAHAYIGLFIGLLAVVGLATGLYMDRVKKKRTALPLIHGLNNLLALVLAVAQVFTGMWVYNHFVLGN
ncbi:MAG: DUF4079 domain-containing protein [Proteobacteria bacterium]|nr:DUF4079 domain-containing protein [Pseudomonadota bacterium]